MSIKCPSCGLVNFANAESCRRCKKALARVTPSVPIAGASEVAPLATGTEILGRVVTKGGFRDLYVIALEDSIVLAPESVIGSLAYNGMPGLMMGGLLGVLIVRKSGQVADQKKRALAEASAEQLRSDPAHTVIPLAGLQSIQFTRHVFSASVEFAARDGWVKYDVNPLHHLTLCDATQRRFPALFRSDERTAMLLEQHRTQAQKKAQR